ncbi:MAG: carbamoyltransferase [Pirellulaceae bacterium]|nr:carbamoyltransferase [Pirellulaceae bacterium]
MTTILGISAYYHDSAAALVQDGRIVAAAQEERFSRQKHDASFPARAIAYCLSAAELRADELDYVAFYDKPLLKFDRLLETMLATAPWGLANFCRTLPVWLREKLHLRPAINEHLGRPRRAPVVFLDHHESHAASAFFPSPFGEAAILTIDGVGEWSTTTLGIGRGNRLELTDHLTFPHSLGLLYSAFTTYCGFAVNDGEYKLMGLAPYGRPEFRELILRHLVDLKPDGSFRLNLDCFDYCRAARMTSRRFDRLFDGPPRKPAERIEQRHMDLAASIQAVTEEIVLRMARELHRRTGLPNLAMAGGVALNCVANGRILREGPFERIWIQPAAGDAGGALGAALFVWHQLCGGGRVDCDGRVGCPHPSGNKEGRQSSPCDTQQGSLLGPEFSAEQVAEFLDRQGISYRRISSREQLFREVAEQLATGKVVGWFRGRMEFGPRALGSRSILADARRPEMQSLLNQKIKLREGFRPFAPAVLTEHVQEWFDLPRGQESPYMLLTAPLHTAQRIELSPRERELLASDPDLARRAAVVRSTLPAVTHVDYSARVQTVARERFPDFHALLSAFHRHTGCPVLVNTSFNRKDEPIVCTPEDAWRCFQATGIDLLVLEDCLIEKRAPRDSHPAADAGQEAAHAMV